MWPEFCTILFILCYSHPGAVFASPDPQVKDALLSSPQETSPNSGQSVDDGNLAQTQQPLPGDVRVASNRWTESRTGDRDIDEETVTLKSFRHPEENASYERSIEDVEALAGSDGNLSKEGEAESGITPEDLHGELLPVFKEALLGYYVKRAIHQPVCILFRPHGSVSQLERQVHRLWVKVQTERPNLYGSWRLGAFFNQSKPTRGFRVPDQLPALRCYIGTASPADYRSSGKAKDLHRWLRRQAVKYGDKIPEYSEEAVSALPASTELVLIAFVNEESHFEMESQMNQLRESYKDGIRLLMVHPNSQDASRLMRQYEVQTLPAVVVLDTKGMSKSTAVQRFEGSSLSVDQVKSFLSLRMSPIAVLTLENFESHVVRPEAQAAVPIFVCFHAPWGRDTGSYLDALRRSATEFHQADGTGLAFGSLDLTRHAEVVTRWVDATYAKRVPFSVLFWWKAGDDDERGPVRHQKLFPDTVPTPWSLAEFLEENKVPLLDAEGEEMQYSPWAGHDVDDEISYGFTRYSPQTCSAAANSSLGAADVGGDLCDPSGQQRPKRSKVKKKKRTEGTQAPKSSWIKKKPNADSTQLKIGGIPQVTDSTWSSIVERSPASASPLRPRPPRTGDVASTTLVAFVQTDCSSCRRKLPVFERLLEPLKMNDGASMFIMNCTSDPKTCSQLHVIGFPALIAFRGYGRLGSEQCVTHGQAAQLLRMDFHGMLEEKSIMEWFSEISLPAVKKLASMKEFTQLAYQKDDVVLLATTYPLSLAGQYLPKPAGSHSWYPLDCYRVACERLYGRASCLAAMSENLGRRDVERGRREEALIVTQVEMFRRDGIKSLIFSLGRNLMVTLQDESDSQTHAFHSPHRYNLKEGQRCEDDHASCTDLMVAFVQDHGRLPVTHLTMTGFHTHSGTKFGEHHENSIFEHDLPVMIALANKGSLMQGAQFIDAFTSAAYEFYNQMVFVTLNADEFPKWAAQFVPLGYRQQMLEYSDRITEEYIPSLNVYPRLCIVRQDDHRHAAMFPPAGRFTLAPAGTPRVITSVEIVKFAREFLRGRGDGMLLRTEQF